MLTFLLVLRRWYQLKFVSNHVAVHVEIRTNARCRSRWNSYECTLWFMLIFVQCDFCTYVSLVVPTEIRTNARCRTCWNSYECTLSFMLTFVQCEMRTYVKSVVPTAIRTNARCRSCWHSYNATFVLVLRRWYQLKFVLMNVAVHVDIPTYVTSVVPNEIRTNARCRTCWNSYECT